VSIRLDPADQPARNITVFTGIGRLRPGATFARAQEELEVLEAELQAEHPEHAASNLQVRVVPFLKDVVKTAERDLLLLLGAVAFVLLIACANVANLLLERGRARARELAIRAALGSGRAGLVRLALAESALLALTGGALGLALAAGSLELLARLGSASVPRLDAVRIDGTVLSFVAAACALCTVLVGLLPALRASAGDPAEVLVADARSGGGPGQARFRDALVVLEVAASFVLLVGTGLMIRSFLALGSVDPGYDPRDLLTFRLSLPSTSFPEWGSRQALHEELLGALEALPGVQGAATVDQLPLTGTGILQPYAYDEETALDWESVTADRRWVSPGFFETMGARLLEGRAFTSEDAGLWRVIIDDRLAERAFPGRSAVGERLQVRPNGSEDPYADVVGVVSHLNLLELGRAHLPQIYTVDPGLPQASVLVRVTGDPERLVPSVRRITARLAPGAPVEDVRTMEEVVRAALAPARLALVLMALFGAGALLLACVGIYGVLSNAVSSRTREIGIRLALGRSPARVRADVLGEGMRLVAVALVLGFVAALVLSRALRASLYGVGPWDPATYAGVGLVLAAVAALACWSPARRATSVDPAETLRTE
jgi:putative ABC transport system permease protein